MTPLCGVVPAVKSPSLRRRLAFMTVSREKCPARLLSDTGTLERCGTPLVSNRSEGPQMATFHCSEDIVGHLKCPPSGVFAISLFLRSIHKGKRGDFIRFCRVSNQFSEKRSLSRYPVHYVRNRESASIEVSGEPDWG